MRVFPAIVRSAAYCCLLVSGCAFAQSAAPAAVEQVTVDMHAATTPLPHFWEQMFGSGRAILSLRESYRRDLREVKVITGFQYVRFHAIFHDEVGVYDGLDKSGAPVYNWSYVDEIYDGLLANGVKPFVELSFMPKAMALRQDQHAFWYKQIVSPPKDYNQWGALVQAFTQHLVDRYGIDEVAQWYFEVWNEPNIDFWTGRPAQSTYFELYDHAARAVKAVSPRLRVGGPATAQAAWVDAMIAHATENKVPLDFVSTHVYGNDTAQDVFGHPQPIAPHGMVCAAVKKVHAQIKASARPEMPLIWSEFNATYMNQQEITDSLYMGPWMARTISECDGMVEMMSYWDFADVFEEQGVVKTPFYGGYGLIAEENIPKPAFDDFALLHTLGTQRIANAAPNVLVTKRDDGALVIAAWNLVEPEASAAGAQNAPAKQFEFKLTEVSASVSAGGTANIARVDAEHGDTLDAWKRMGEPRYPTREQAEQLRAVAKLPAPEESKLHDGVLRVSVPRNGLAIITVK